MYIKLIYFCLESTNDTDIVFPKCCLDAFPCSTKVTLNKKNEEALTMLHIVKKKDNQLTAIKKRTQLSDYSPQKKYVL